jgi:murein DD-endopeptidase MepM/ murein hydrolase activator NlpD
VAAVDGWTSLSGRWNALFRDHEIYVRTGGQVRFVTIGAAGQRRAAALAAWLAATAALLGWQAWTAWQTRDVAARSLAIEQAEARVAAERRSVEEIARTIDARQDRLESLVGAHFGTGLPADAPAAPAGPPAAGAPPAVGAPPAGATPALASGRALVPTPASLTTSPSAAAPDARTPATDPVARLKAAAARQDQLVALLGTAVDRRSAEVETVLRQVGIRPSATSARGGPFIPLPGYAGNKDLRTSDPAIHQLALRLDRMAQLESLLDAVPTGIPTDDMQLSSGFGMRYDPFNGARAMHAGLDFTGPHGSAIRAAAAGRVIFAGVKSGYGNVVEIAHGHGIETRYAHLSGFAAKVGDTVQSGELIGRMGSTGRSTGTHLHFEVRVGGTAVNPRRFLEANTDVLEVKADADARLRSTRVRTDAVAS